MVSSKAATPEAYIGKSCVRFKKAEDLAEDVLAQAIARGGFHRGI